MLASLVFTLKNSKFCKLSLKGLHFAFCFILATVPAFAASTGNENLYTSTGTGIPIWKLGLILIELIFLGIIWKLILSDLSVIRWFEKKKKTRL